MSDLRRRIVTTAFREATPEEVVVDTGSFIERLLLFDTFVLRSRNLQEIPHLVRRFGIEAVVRLFKSKAIELSVDKSAIGFMNDGVDVRDPYVVDAQSFQLVQPASMQKDFQLLRESFEVSRKSSWRSLNGALRRAIEAAPPDLDRLRAAPTELIADFREAATSPGRMAPYVTAALERHGVEHGGRPVRFDVSLDDTKLGVDTDLEAVFDFTVEEAGDIVRTALAGLSGEVSRVHEMRLYNALTPFADADAPLFGAHLDFAVRNLHPGTPTGAFYRIVEVKDLPDLRRPEVADTVNLHAVLDARRSPEGEAFRAWLWTAADLSDRELEEQLEYHVATLGERFGFFLKTPPGRRLRWLAVQGLAPVVGAAAGAAVATVSPEAGVLAGMGAAGVSYVNSFVLDKIIPSGPENALPAAFVATRYPSVFDPGIL